jgi:succinate dehydrogenase / fumarate reductase flavoprotein subunit
VVVDGKPVHGFYAAGECACASVHGANRLGTNSLLDLLVFGKSSANSMIEFIKQQPLDLPALATADVERSVARVARLDNQTGGVEVSEARDAMQRTMQNHCGVFRFKDMLAQGVEKILEVEGMVKKTQIHDKSKVFNTARIEALELENLIEVAKSTMISANARTESRGAHVRDDAPDTAETPNGRDDQNWLKHTLWHRDDNRLEYKPVNMNPLTVESIALKTRSY